MMQLKLHVYRKLFLSSVSIFITAVVILVIGIAYNYVKTVVNYEQNENEKKVTELAEMLHYDQLSIGNAVYSLYESPQMATDMVNYLQLDSEQYYNYRLSQVANQNNLYYQGHETFVRNIFNRNSRVIGVGVYSYEQDMLTTFKSYGSTIVTRDIKLRNQNSLIEQLVATRFDLETKYAVPITYPIKHLHQNELLGEVIVFQGLDFVNDVLARYDDKVQTMEFISSNGRVLFDSTGQKPFLTAYQPEKSKHQTTYAIQMNNLEYFIHDYFHYTNILADVGVEFFYGLCGVLLILGIGIYFIWQRIRQAEQRFEKLLAGISEIEAGNLEAEIIFEEEENDELGIIADRLNSMNRELKRHIQDQYLAEINQQKAELAYLQSQINPHFLYNTLETIRMKAIIEGNREVGTLIYGLGTLFRKSYQKSRVILLREELELIETYFMLFMNRYPDAFSYEIVCDETIQDVQVVKFILQPIIENYFIHGLDYTRQDNKIKIVITKQDDNMNILITDNGAGMTVEAIDTLHKRLEQETIYEVKHSIALININKRLALAYRENYELKFETTDIGGLCVKVRVPIHTNLGGLADVENRDY